MKKNHYTLRRSGKIIVPDRVTSGEWVKPTMSHYFLGCCDCGLIHRFDFRIRRRKVEFRAFRDGANTGRARRMCRFVCRKKNGKS